MDRPVEQTEELFALKKVHYDYPGEIEALKEVDLQVHRGRHVAILGANGSGKSTLLKVMDGLYYPQAGEVYAFGRPLTERALEDESYAASFRRRVGLIFQDPDVQLFSATVWDEVAFAPLQLNRPLAEVRERVEGMLQWLNLAHLRDRPPYRLSGGEKRKVALASVLVVEPEVLLLDEPTTFLDPRSLGQLLDFTAEWAQRGGTLVLCSHDLELAEELAAESYLLDGGRVLAHGATRDLLADQALLEQAGLLQRTADKKQISG